MFHPSDIGSCKWNQDSRLGPKGLATDIVGELCARATVFDDGKNKAAIVLLDMSEFFPNITMGIRQLASRWTQIPAENIMVCATHTHSSAKVIDYDDPYDTGGVMVEYEKLSDRTQAYLDMLYRYAASVVFLADARRKPATGRIGEISVPGSPTDIGQLGHIDQFGLGEYPYTLRSEYRLHFSPSLLLHHIIGFELEDLLQAPPQVPSVPVEQVCLLASLN